MMFSHIHFLMGCAFPVCATYILVSGAVYTSEWTLWSLSGVVFLGIGDFLSGYLGRKYGSVKWRELSSKTQEGSAYSVFGMMMAYYILCKVVDDHHMYYYACYMFASIPSAMIEGCTILITNRFKLFAVTRQLSLSFPFMMTQLVLIFR